MEKRQMSNKMEYKDLLNAYTVSDLKNILKSWEYTGYSKYKKNELIDAIEDTVNSSLSHLLPELNLDHFTIIFQLYQGKNVFNEFPEAARRLIELGLILEGMIDGQKQVLLSNEIYLSFNAFYQQNQDLIAFNTILKDYLELSIEMYGVMTENEFVEDFYVFNEGAIEREVIQNLLPAVIRNSSNSTSSKEFIHYFRLAEFEKVYLDLSQKHEIERKKIQPEMLQSFVQNLNSLDHECFDSVKQQMGKYLKGDEQLFNQTIDEMRVMMSYNHSMSDFLHLFSKKHEITEMQILKDLADDLIVINNELPHWELKGNAPVELVSLKNQPVIKGEKVGRNDLCPCGSGKKYKKCCLVK